MTLIMRDSVTPMAIPLAGTDIAAFYGDGAFADGTLVRKRFPHTPVIGIDVNGSMPSMAVRDWETGDKAGSLEDWVINHNNSTGVKDAVVYCNKSTLPEVRQLTGSQILGVDYFLWVATLDGTIFGPQDYPHVLACQDKGSSQVHANYDESLVWTTAPVSWTGYVKPAPLPPVVLSYPAPRFLRLTPGHTGFKVTWTPPVAVTGLPEPQYDIWVRHAGDLVLSYPRTGIKGTEYSGGSLARGTDYTLSIVATGPNQANFKGSAAANINFQTA
jgi:hypothetical protein